MTHSWIFLALASAILLGLYDVCKKMAVNKNLVPMALWLAALGNAILMLPELLIATPPLAYRLHALIILKSLFVAISWSFSYQAQKHLPVSISAPVIATGPLMTAFAGWIALNEIPRPAQWLGLGVFTAGLYLLSRVSKKEAIRLTHNKWVWFLLMGALFGTFSGILDRYLMRLPEFPGTSYQKAVTMQVWFSIYTPLWLLIPLLLTLKYKVERATFRFTWWIPIISISLILADRFYFIALTDSDALLSVVTCLRRTSIIVAVLVGGYGLKEKNIFLKSKASLVMVAGIVLLLLG